MDWYAKEVPSKFGMVNISCWLDDDETPISDKELLKAIQSKEISISLSEGGLAEMFFDDGDFFGGHSIVVWHNTDGMVDRAHLAG